MMTNPNEILSGKPKQLQPKTLCRYAALGIITAALLLHPTPSTAWQSTEGQNDSTHKRLARQGADLLDENIERYPALQAANEILQWNMNQLEEGAVAPDFNTDTPYYIGANLFCKRAGRDCRAQNLYSDHFYDADSHEGLSLSSILIYNSRLFFGPLGDRPPENAESQTRRYISIAIATWKDAVEEQKAGRRYQAEALFAEAVYWLGYASHYFSDIFEPHHAANYPWGPINRSHTEFEILVNDRLDEFLPENDVRSNRWDYTTTNKYSSIWTLVTDYANTYASKAKFYLGDCIHGYFWGFPRAWKNAAHIMTRANRDVLSLLYFRFLTEVTEYDQSRQQKEPAQQFSIEIEMGDGFVPLPRERHPSESIALRIDFSGGQSKTWTLDTRNFYRWYAFDTDARSSYFLDWGDDMPYPSEVDSVSLVREFDWWARPWEVETFSLYLHGHRSLHASGTMPLLSGEEIVFPVSEGF